jgi:two-component system NtrC family sensor kinase
MKIGTRLIILLTLSISAVDLVGGLVTLRQREASLLEAARVESRAHALTLKIALEEDYLSGRTLDAQRLITRLRDNTGLFSLLLFDRSGALQAISNDLAPEEVRYFREAKQVITTGESIEIERSIGGEDFFSLITPLQLGEERVGAIEIIQPISFVQAHIAKARQHLVLTLLLMVVTVFLVVYLVTRYSLIRPVEELLNGARAVGRGDLNYRVIVARGGSELTSLAREFNRMADRLAEQRGTLQQETEGRISLERRLRQSEQLAAVGHLAAGVAHEMGAPLQVIDGRAKQLLHHPDASTETRQRNLTIIRNQAARITRIVRQLLNLARPYSLHLHPISPDELIRETVEMLESQAEKAGVSIEIPNPPLPELPTLLADPELLQQVLLNLCQNGIQAMPQGGTLSISRFPARSRHLAFVGPHQEGSERDYLAIQIADTGEGIPQGILPRIFDPFFTTKDVGSGTGLGLAVSRRIIEEHEGWIEAANRPGGGAIFTLFLPLPELSERWSVEPPSVRDHHKQESPFT